MTDRITEIRSRYGDRRSNVYLKDIQTLLAELDKRNAEIRAVDAVLARRPALEAFDNRVDKILHAIQTAAEVDPLKAKIRRLESKP